MEIKDLELTPPSKEAMQFLKNFIYEHDKGLKAIKTLEEIREIAEYEFKDLMNADDYHNMTEILQQILQKINEVIDD